MRIHYLALLLLGLAAIPANATLIDFSPPNDNATDMTNGRTAAAFNLAAPATLNTLNFWYQAQFQTDLSTLTYAFYQDNSGSLGSLMNSATVTPVTSTDATAFFAQVSLPGLSFNSGTYWLELHAGSSLTDDNGTITVWWSNTDSAEPYADLTTLNTNPPSQSGTVPGFQYFAFQLDSGSPVSTAPTAPEPSTVFSCMVGGFILIWRVRRIHRR